ncbi:MAG: Loki-CTERM sorting domain-containing protein, partial [Promethearchaeota archaeon]
TLPSSINVTNIIPLFYAYNMSGSLDWSGAPSSFYDESVILDAATNSIILHMNKTMFSKGIISGLSYVLIEEVLQEIPGYDIFLMSFLVIIVSALIIRKRRKKF